MQILQVKTQNDFNTANPGEGTVLIWPEVISQGDETGKVILHSKTSSGVMKEIGTGFGQEVDIKTDEDISNASVTTSVIPYLRLNEDEEVELVAKKSDGTVVQVAGGGSGFGKPSNILTDEDISDPDQGKVTPYFRDEEGQPSLVLKTSSGEILPVGGSDMIPAICVGVDEQSGTCIAMAVDIIQNEDGTITSKYKGSKITNLIYTWPTPVREDLTLKIEGCSDTLANANYVLEDEYNFDNDRIWINQTTSTYGVKYDTTNTCWTLYSDIENSTSIATETTKAKDPFGQEVSWNPSGITVVVVQSTEE